MGKSSGVAKSAKRTRRATYSPAATTERRRVKRRRTEMADSSDSEDHRRETAEEEEIAEGDEQHTDEEQYTDEERYSADSRSDAQGSSDDSEEHYDDDDEGDEDEAEVKLGDQARQLLKEVVKHFREELDCAYKNIMREMKTESYAMRRFIVEQLDMRTRVVDSREEVVDQSFARARAIKPNRPAARSQNSKGIVKRTPPMRASDVASRPSKRDRRTPPVPPVRTNGVASKSASASRRSTPVRANGVASASTSKIVNTQKSPSIPTPAAPKSPSKSAIASKSVPTAARDESEEEVPSKKGKERAASPKKKGLRVPSPRSIEEVIANMEYGNPDDGMPPLSEWPEDWVIEYPDKDSNVLRYHRHMVLYEAFVHICERNTAQFLRLFDPEDEGDMGAMQANVQAYLKKGRDEEEIETGNATGDEAG